MADRQRFELWIHCCMTVFKTVAFNHSAICPFLVDPTGLEPVTDRLWAGCSNQLSYRSKSMISFRMVAPARVELATSRVWTVRSNQLSYRAYWWRVWDSNPRPPACKAGALANWANPPMVKKTGFEPATPWSQTKCSTKLSYFSIVLYYYKIKKSFFI